MHPFMIEALAHQHQMSLLREADKERMTKHVDDYTNPLSIQKADLRQVPLSELDFAAIRHDLRSTLSEWCLEAGTASSEAVIDTFMRRLRMRLGYSQRCKETRASF